MTFPMFNCQTILDIFCLLSLWKIEGAHMRIDNHPSDVDTHSENLPNEMVHDCNLRTKNHERS